MTSFSRRDHLLVFAMMLVQTPLMAFGGGPLAVLLPPLLFAVPIAIATLANDQTVRQIAPRRRGGMIASGLLGAAVIASFVLVEAELSFKLSMARAPMADVAICWATVLLLLWIRTTRQKAAA